MTEKTINTNIDELIEQRKIARENKDWAKSDEIRNSLDSKLCFVFDTKEGQEIYHLTKKYFESKSKRIETEAMSNRQFVEFNIQSDIRANKMFDAWLYSVNKNH